MPAQVTRGRTDEVVESIRARLDEYLAAHPGAAAELYRQNSVSVRVRITDEAFRGLSRADRHDAVWKFLADGLPEDTVSDISVLLLHTPDEKGKSLSSLDFDNPLPSRF